MKLLDVEKIYDENELLEEVIKDLREIVESQGLDFEEEVNLNKFSSKEKYIWKVQPYPIRLLSKLEELVYVVPLINSYPETDLWAKAFNREDYLKYHLSSYYTNVVGVFDRSLKLINKIYNLGLKDKNVNYSIVKTNTHLKNTRTKEVLCEFSEFLRNSNIRELRNDIIHSGQFYYEELNLASILSLYQESNNVEEEMGRIAQILRENKIRTFINDCKSEAKKINSTVFSFTDSLLNSLLDKYKQEKKKLSHN